MRDRDKEYDEFLDVWNKSGAFYERYQASHRIPKALNPSEDVPSVIQSFKPAKG